MGATLDHESFPQPTEASVWLWRYMDLSKFAALLQKGALIFPRADLLGDPFEGSVPEANARFYEAITALRSSGGEDPFAGMPDEAIKQIAEQMSRGRRKMVTTTFVSCWHMNDRESAAMWKLYSSSSDAVAVRTDYATLAAALPSECFLGVVRYIDFKLDAVPEGNLLNPIMVKRRSFAHEHEARAVIWDGESFGHDKQLPAMREVAVDLHALIKGIYVSPDAPDWFRDVVAGLVTRYGLTVPVEHSEMNATPLY